MMDRDRPTLLSLNRFEGKKNVALAVEAFHLARQEKTFDQTTRLVIGGKFTPVGLDTHVK